MGQSPQILYAVPDYAVPSWGVGMLYHHVRILADGGFRAAVLHERAPFRIDWLELEVPIRHRLPDAPPIESADVLVVPEVSALDADLQALPCRRVVFVQNGFSIFSSGPAKAVDYRALGYEAAMVTMPHLAAIVGAHCGLTPALVPPFVAPYFFVDEARLDDDREREILLFAKAQYGEAGYPDRDIFAALVSRHLERLPPARRWKLVELAAPRHLEVARAMRRAALFVNLNLLEGFNVMVAEAMAAGAIAVCYEACGGRDYVRAGDNAFLFANNDVFALVETVCDLVTRFDERREELARMRRAALATARSFRREGTASALTRFFTRLLR